MGRALDWLELYRRLYTVWGPQQWWPAESAFEVMVGAVLTQNTAWVNVERAIANLKKGGCLDCRLILAQPTATLAELIRPAGYYNVKARRLKALCAFLEAEGVSDAPERLRDLAPLSELRRRLLAVYGIGEETADSILLYALKLPIFVVDAYTRRIFTRLGFLYGRESYAQIQQLFMANVDPQVALYNEYHALIVKLGKSICRPRPRCAVCPLCDTCNYGSV